MNQKTSLALALLFFALTPLRAAEKTADAKMREMLRNTMLQLRDSENARATLQAQQAESEQKNKTLTGQVEALTKQLAADKTAADRKASVFDAKIADQEKQIAVLRDSLEKSQAAFKQADETARTKEAQRAKLAETVIALERRVADQQVKNSEMFQVGSQILKRYEKMSLGEAIVAREPFTGIAKVKLKSLVQDYEDKLVDSKIKP